MKLREERRESSPSVDAAKSLPAVTGPTPGKQSGREPAARRRFLFEAETGLINRRRGEKTYFSPAGARGVSTADVRYFDSCAFRKSTLPRVVES